MDAFGNAIGNSIVSKLSQPPKPEKVTEDKVRSLLASNENMAPGTEVKSVGQLADERLSSLEQQYGITNDEKYRYKRISSLLENADLSVSDTELLSNLKQFEYDARLLKVADVAYGEFSESTVASGLAEGQRIISAVEFKNSTGIILNLDHGSDYQGVLVYDEAIDSLILGNRGTESLRDVGTDVIQSIGFEDKQYIAAHDNAIALSKYVKGSGLGLAFTGHSLGGGLAATQALATGFKATTFNAAGIHSDTLQRLQVDNGNVKQSSDLVRNYFVDGEILTAVQSSTIADAFSGVVGTVIRTPIEAGKALYGLFDDDVKANFGFSYVPEAAGRMIELPAVDLDGNAITGLDWVTGSPARHKMDYVHASMGMYGYKLYSELGN